MHLTAYTTTRYTSVPGVPARTTHFTAEHPSNAPGAPPPPARASLVPLTSLFTGYTGYSAGKPLRFGHLGVPGHRTRFGERTRSEAGTGAIS